jgi:hypothetical protein
LAVLESPLAEEPERTDRMLLLSNVGVIRAARGEDVTAILAELEEMAKSESEQMMVVMSDTTGSAAMADGRLREAADAWRGISTMTASYAPAAYYQAARPTLWAGDLEQARRDLEALDATGVHGKIVELRRTTIRAGIRALEGGSAEALTLYREALRGWHDLGLVWDETLTALDMATLLDPSLPEVQAAADGARATLARLGAKPYLERLEAAMSRPSEPTAASGSRRRTAVAEAAAPEVA